MSKSSLLSFGRFHFPGRLGRDLQISTFRSHRPDNRLSARQPNVKLLLGTDGLDSGLGNGDLASVVSLEDQVLVIRLNDGPTQSIPVFQDYLVGERRGHHRAAISTTKVPAVFTLILRRPKVIRGRSTTFRIHRTSAPPLASGRLEKTLVGGRINPHDFESSRHRTIKLRMLTQSKVM